MFLLIGPQVVQRVHHNQPEGDDDADEAEDGAEDQAEVVEGEAMVEGLFDDVLVLEGGVTR